MGKVNRLLERGNKNRFAPASETEFDTTSYDKYDFVKFFGDRYTTLGIKSDGTAWIKGANYYGQLGLGYEGSDVLEFQYFDMTDIKEFVTLEYANVILKNDGTIWVIGRNQYGQIGMNLEYGDSTAPLKTWTQLSLTNVKQICGAYYGLYALTYDGDLYYTGYNNRGQFGNGTKDIKYVLTKTSLSNVSKICNEKGYSRPTFSMFLTTSGILYGVGSAKYGIQGSNYDEEILSFRQLASNVQDASLSNNHMIVVLKNGDICARGYNADGQIANNSYGTTYNYYNLDKVYFNHNGTKNQTRPEGDVNLIYAGYSKSFVVINNELYAAGSSHGYGLGLFGGTQNASEYRFTSFTKVPLQHNKKITRISFADEYLTLIDFEDGTFECAGSASYLPYLGANVSDNFTCFSRIKPYCIDGYDEIHNIHDSQLLLKNNGEHKRISKLPIVALADNTCMVIGTNGVALASGNNYSHRFGPDQKNSSGSVTTTVSCIEVDIKGINVKQAAIAASATLFMTEEGHFYGMGNLSSYFETQTDTTELVRVPELDHLNVKKMVSKGADAFAFITEDNEAYVVGYNCNGQFGFGDESLNLRYKTLTKLPINNVKDISFTLYGYGMIVVTMDHKFYFGGSNNNNCFGNIKCPSSTGHFTTFYQVDYFKDKQVKRAEVGIYHCYVLLENGEVHTLSYESNSYCQSGGYSTAAKKEWSRAFTDIEDIALVSYSAIVLDKSGKVYGIGRTENGEAGYDAGSSNYYAGLNNTSATNIASIYSAEEISVAVSKDGTIYMCGDSPALMRSYSSDDRKYFRRVDIDKLSMHTNIINNKKAKINPGKIITSMLGQTGHPLSTGSNKSYQIRNNSYSHLYSNYFTGFRTVDTTLQNIKEMYNTDTATFFLLENGDVYAKGKSSLFCGASKNTTNYENQLKIPISNVKKIADSPLTVTYLKEDGTVWQYGDNTVGQLGLGHSNAIDKITQVPNMDDVIDIACSKDGKTTYILKSDGTVMGAGADEYRQIAGLSEGSNLSTYTTITTNASKIHAGNQFIIVEKNDGTIWGTGLNSYGQLNGIAGGSDPINPLELSKISVGWEHILILKKDGTVWAYGRNMYKQITGTSDEYYGTARQIVPPVDITSPKALDISAGYHTTHILMNDGCWYARGFNSGDYPGLLGVPTGDTTIKSLTKVTYYLSTGVYSESDKKYVSTKTPYYEPVNYIDQPIYDLYSNRNFALVNGNTLLKTNPGLNWNLILGEHNNNQSYEIKLPIENIKEIHCSDTHTLVLTIDKKVYGVGSNEYGQLCSTPSLDPVTSLTQLNITDVVSVACGSGYSMFVTSDGQLRSVGMNSEYQLALGNNVDVEGIVQTVPGISNAEFVTIADRTAFVLCKDKTLLGQGLNSGGILGIGASTKNSLVRTFTQADVDVTKIEIISKTGKATKTDGTIWYSGTSNAGGKFTGNDVTVFRKVNLPDRYTQNNFCSASLNNDSLFAIVKTLAARPSVVIGSKSHQSVTLNIEDYEYISKIEMFINGNLKTTLPSINGPEAIFSIPAADLVMGQNVILFKTYNTTGEALYSKVIIVKDEARVTFNAGETLLIHGTKYNITEVIIDDVTNKVSLVLDKSLVVNLNAGDLIRKCLNEVEVYHQINNSGYYQKANFSTLQFTEDGYKEEFIVNQPGISSISLKIATTKGNDWTSIKNPTMYFNIDEESL